MKESAVILVTGAAGIVGQAIVRRLSEGGAAVAALDVAAAIPDRGQRLNLPGEFGLLARSWALVTKSVMIVVQMGRLGPPRFVPGKNLPIRDLYDVDPHLWVYDKTTGEKFAQIDLPSNATGAPMTYMAGGKQFIVFPVGGGALTDELIAVGL